MVQRTIAAHSLRHLRFAHRVMGLQSQVARAADGAATPIAAPYISPEGRQLAVAPVLRHVPQHELARDKRAAAQATVDEETATQPEKTSGPIPLRLVPRRLKGDAPAPDDANMDISAPRLPRAPDPSAPDNNATREQADTRITTARSESIRPRARIVELPTSEAANPEPERTPSEPHSTIPETSGAPDDVAAKSVPVDSAAQADGLEEPPVSPPSEQPNTHTAAETSAKRTPEPPRESRPMPRGRGNKPSAPPTPRAADSLFLPTDTDRSAQAWLARLQQAAQPTPAGPAAPLEPEIPQTQRPQDGPAPAPRRRSNQRRGRAESRGPDTSTDNAPSARHASPPPIEQPSPLADSSRSHLQSLTGIDPADVPIYRGPSAERATADENADALTDGDAILLGAGHATDTPETLGLLAHELTHIAQRRSPRFVPPLAQSPVGQRQAQQAATPPQFTATASHADEEAQAGYVEATVRDIARRRTMAPVSEPTLPALPAQARPDRESTQMPPSLDPRATWGNLPAPWEPMPDWLAPVVATQPAKQPDARPPESSSSSPAPLPAMAAPPMDTAPAPMPASADSGIQRADRGRTLPETESESAHVREERAPEPDLDALAQQIHAILKRRLAAERRRFG
ncbi:MAG TPA: DUF4157 domain-containing protein [Ktedonobacterales bacterium]